MTDSPRPPDERPRPTEIEGFRAIRARRRWFWTLFLTFVPCSLLAAIVNQTLGFVVAIVWMSAFAIWGAIFTWSRCPRCGELCFMTFKPLLVWSNSWAKRCVHCKTRLYWSDDELRGGS